jgi:hypothetical protein
MGLTDTALDELLRLESGVGTATFIVQEPETGAGRIEIISAVVGSPGEHCIRVGMYPSDARFYAAAKAALRPLVEEIRELRKRNAAQARIIGEFDIAAPGHAVARLEAEVKRLRGALEYYANPMIYDHIHTVKIGVNNDAGARARAALGTEQEGKG